MPAISYTPLSYNFDRGLLLWSPPRGQRRGSSLRYIEQHSIRLFLNLWQLFFHCGLLYALMFQWFLAALRLYASRFSLFSGFIDASLTCVVIVRVCKIRRERIFHLPSPNVCHTSRKTVTQTIPRLVNYLPHVTLPSGRRLSKRVDVSPTTKMMIAECNR